MRTQDRFSVFCPLSSVLRHQTPQGVVQGISHRHFKIVQRCDGYGYSQRAYHKESEQVTAQARIASQSALYLPGLNAEVSRAK